MKYVVVDSLARSGTTLLTAIIRSQEKCCAFTGVLSEAMAADYAPWGQGQMVLHPFLEQKDPLKPTYMDWNKYKEKALSSRKDLRCGIPDQEWNALFDNVNEDPDQLYTKLCNRFSSDLIALRWNQSISYVHEWIKRPEHYWVVIIRDPLDRAFSAQKAVQWSIENSIKTSVSFFEKLEKIKNDKRVYIMYYEDLISDSKKEITQLFDFFNYPLSYINDNHFVGGDGKEYVAQSVANIGKYGTHRKGPVTHEIYSAAIGRGKQLQNKHKRAHKQNLGHFPLLRRYFHESNK